MRRAAVVGTSGSGKTTFARALAARLSSPHVELDALHWEPNWRMAELDVFRARVDQATRGDRWATDGSYSKVRDLVWGRAEAIVWLDYPLPLILARLFRRTATRVVTRQELWSGNRERLRDHLGRDSIFLWAVQQHRRNRHSYPEALADPAYAHLELHLSWLLGGWVTDGVSGTPSGPDLVVGMVAEQAAKGRSGSVADLAFGRGPVAALRRRAGGGAAGRRGAACPGCGPGRPAGPRRGRGAGRAG